MRSTRAIEGGLVVAAAVLLSLGGCRGPLDAPILPAHPSDETPRRGGTLHLATFLGDVSTLDPATSSDTFSAGVNRLVYAGLVDYDASGHLVPDLAASIELLDEGRTYRFTLREGARFHDGSEVTAAEVKRLIERALHPTTPSPRASLFDDIDGFSPFTSKKASHLAGVVVEGRYVLAIHVREPDATFLERLALTNMRVTCASAGDTYSPSWAPCGAGPFKLMPGGWERGRSLTLVRNESYFRSGAPYLDAITWELGSTPIGEGYKFARGDIDLLADLTQAETIRYQSDPRWMPFGAYDPPSAWGDAMNTQTPPFDNVEVRRAVAAAIDRDHIVLLRASNFAPLDEAGPGAPGLRPAPHRAGSRPHRGARSHAQGRLRLRSCDGARRLACADRLRHRSDGAVGARRPAGPAGPREDRHSPGAPSVELLELARPHAPKRQVTDVGAGLDWGLP